MLPKESGNVLEACGRDKTSGVAAASTKDVAPLVEQCQHLPSLHSRLLGRAKVQSHTGHRTSALRTSHFSVAMLVTSGRLPSRLLPCLPERMLECLPTMKAREVIFMLMVRLRQLTSELSDRRALTCQCSKTPRRRSEAQTAVRAAPLFGVISQLRSLRVGFRGTCLDDCPARKG